MNILRLLRVGNSLYVSVPADIRRELHLDRGTYLLAAITPKQQILYTPLTKSQLKQLQERDNVQRSLAAD